MRWRLTGSHTTKEHTTNAQGPEAQFWFLSQISVNFDRWASVILLMVLLFGLSIRLRQFFGCPSYWYDEAYLLVNIYDKDYHELLGALRAQVVMPPLYLWLLRGLYLFLGGGEWAMRLPATVFSICALLLMFFVARAAVGARWAFLAVALCAVSNHAMVHANEVRPYSSDFLMTEVIVLAGGMLLTSSLPQSARTWCRNGLLALACLAPWFSFPSVLVLGGVSLALLFDLLTGGGRITWPYWISFNTLLLLAVLSLWWVQARHLYYPGLHEHWIGWGGFPKDYSPGTLLGWTVRCFIGIGNYGTTSMGVPLLLLGLVGDRHYGAIS
jgi:hypothetical protein